jgi:hypothetical protein
LPVAQGLPRGGAGGMQRFDAIVMPAIENFPITESASIEPAGPIRAMRIDPPHEIPRADAPVAALQSTSTPPSEASLHLPLEMPVASDAAASTDIISPALVRQFRTQAQQLASHLEVRQRELDHREAELHTQLARHEAAARSARLWFQEQNRRLTQRQSEWEQREREIADRMRSFGGPAIALPDRDTTVGGAHETASNIDDEIEFRLREAELHERSAQLEASYQHSGSVEKKLDARHQQVEIAEARLARHEAELQFARQELHAEREAFAARVENQRRQAADDRMRLEQELSQRRGQLDEWASQLEKRAAAIEQLRCDLLLTQRDTLESQLAAEELRAELAGKAPPATIVQSMARLRAKLADQYRLQREELERAQSDIAAQTDSIAKQQSQWTTRQKEFEAWIASQHRQIEGEAAQLASREEQIERQQNERETRCLQWEAARRELEAEIRQLQAHVRRLEENALELA